MKKLLIYLVLALLLFSSCSSNPDNEEELNNVKFADGYILEKTTQEYLNGNVKSTVSYPIIKGLNDSKIEKKINDTIKENLSDYIEALSIEGFENDAIIISYEVPFCKSRILTVNFDISVYTMNGKLIDSILDAYNFDLFNGEVLDIRDIFIDGDFETTLNALLGKKVEGMTLKTPYAGIDDFQNFYLTEDNLVVYYLTHIYTEPEDGHLKLEIPYDDIKGILNKQMLF